MSQTTKESKDLKDAKASGKPRVFALAAELGLETKAVLEFCKELGYAGIKNQLNALEPDQADAVRSRAKRGSAPPPTKPAPAAPAAPPRPMTPPKLDDKIRTLPKPAARPAPAPVVAPKPAPVADPVPAPVAEVSPVATPAPSAPTKIPTPPSTPATSAEAPLTSPEPDPLPAVLAPRTDAPKVKPAPAPVAEEPKPVAPAPAPEPSPVAVELPPAPSVTVIAPASAEPQVAPAAEVPAPVAEAAPPRMPTLPPTRLPNLSSRPQPLANRPQVLPPRPPHVPTQTAAPAPTPAARPQPAATPTPAIAPPAARAPQPQPQPPAANVPPRPPVGSPGNIPGRPASLPPNVGPPRTLGQPPAPQRPGGAAPGGFGPSRGPTTPPRPGPANAPMGGFGPTGRGPGGFGPSSPGGRPPVGAPGPMGPGGRPPMNRGPAGPGAPAPGGAGATPANRSVKLTPEQIQRLRQLEAQRGGQKLNVGDVHKLTTDQPGGPNQPAGPNQPGGPQRPGFTPTPRPFTPATAEDSGDNRGPGGPGAKRPDGVTGRDARQRARQDKGRNRGPSTDRGAVIIGAGGRVDMIEAQFGSRAKVHRGRKVVKQPVVATGGQVEISTPINVRSLSEAIGMKVGEMLLKLKGLTGELYTINSMVDFDVAEMLSLDRKIELVRKKTADAEQNVLEQIQQRNKDREEHLVPRPPIVTIMGHVDHGKTSLLDKIRQQYGLSSDVVSTEAGGITQVIRAWRVQKEDKSVTFLDTPGHEAFTKMRARGANVTDIAVIVVSAVDGIMPQTQEAVSHAKAADVDIIIAINKSDLPGANPDKIKSQLYGLELVPEEMGGDVPVILTSAVTGQGVGELLDSIALLAELNPDMKADPDVPASGTCLEAYLDPEEGVQATLLIQMGTLHRGDVMLCGSTFGKVRSMVDDLGRPIDEAGPSTPVRVTGLDEVPDADDPFYAVPEVGTAREIAEKRKDRKQAASHTKFTPISLENIKARQADAKITELKVILKAEARGSVEAIRKELEKLTHEEVRVRVLHAGIGAITESDVSLALTSPADTLIVGFNVTADDAALRMADERGLTDKIREYDIIYKLTADIKAALEGKLKPVEEVVHLGRAVIRQTFKVGKVGVIAGCYVTSGTIERSARVRVIREGVVLFPSSDKHVGLESLKRFKDDAKEVREGFECGLKIMGFDDVKVGDVIEAFKIEIRQRTL